MKMPSWLMNFWPIRTKLISIQVKKFNWIHFFFSLKQALSSEYCTFQKEKKLRISAPLGLPKVELMIHWKISNIDGVTAKKTDLEGQLLCLVERYWPNGFQNRWREMTRLVNTSLAKKDGFKRIWIAGHIDWFIQNGLFLDDFGQTWSFYKTRVSLIT